ncbi:MAG: PAS domain S-box protein [Asgard group archaeon]|nr:PAS domain S-box protein [Asgard group archaeon]
MKNPLKILHLEDNKMDAALVKETLLLNDIDCEITLVDNREDFVSNINNNQFDVILADYNLPTFDGFSALELSKKIAKDIPFIFISGVLGEETAIETLKKGAVDYVIKMRIERLAPAIERALREKEEREQRILLEREIVELDQMINEMRTLYQELTKRVRGFLKIELPDGKYSIVDKFLEDLSGYQIKEWQNTPNFIGQLIHPDFQEYYNDNFEQLKDGIVPKMLEYKITRKDGAERWWLQFNIGAFDAEGKLASVSAVIVDNTDDKNAQLRYEDLFKNALTGMYRSDIKTGKIIEANEKMAQIFGCETVEEFKKFDASQFYPDIEVRKELIEKLESVGYYEEEVLQLKKVDGTLVWISENSKIYPEEGYVEGMLIDITDRKHAEDAIIRDRKVFQIIAEAAVHSDSLNELCITILNGLIDVLDFDHGTIRLYNPRDEMLYPIAVSGVAEDITRNLPAVSIHDRNHMGANVAKTRKELFAPDVLKIEHLKDRKSLVENLVVRANISWPILSAKQDLIGVLQLVSQKPRVIVEEDRALFQTISGMIAAAIEHKRAEESLKESEEKFRAFAEQSVIGLTLSDQEGNFIFFNETVSDIIEYSEYEISYLTVDGILDKIMNTEYREKIRKQIANTHGDVPQSLPAQEYEIKTKLGKTKWLSISLTPLSISEGVATATVIIEITEEKIAQQTLERERQAFRLLAEATLNAKDIHDLCQRILSGLMDTLKFENGTFRIFDKKDQTLYPYAALLKKESQIKEIKPLHLNDETYLNTYVARTKEPIFAPDISKHENAMKFLSRLERFEAKANITWPILNADNELLGTIQIVASEPKEFSPADKFFFETIVRFFATALEREWSKEALEESREQYRRLVETSPFAIINTDLQGTILTINQQSLNLLKLSSDDELLNKNFFEFFDKESQKRVNDDLDKIKEHGSLSNIEYQMNTSDGKLIPVELSISLIVDDEQNPESYIFIGQDISIRKSIEERQRRLSNIIRNSPQAILSSNTDGIFVYANPIVEQIFGYKPDEIIGQPISILSPKGQEKIQQDLFDEVLKRGKKTLEITRKHKNGHLIPLIMTISPVLDEDGNIQSLNSMLVDLSEIKELRESLKSRYHEFEVLNKVISVGYRAKNLDEFLDFLLDIILKSLDFTGGGIFIVDAINNVAKLERSMGMPKILTSNIQEVNLDSIQFKRLFKDGKTVVLDDFKAIEGNHDHLDVKSLISIPFFSRQKVIGALTLISREKQDITDEDIRILEAIGRDAGTAIAKFIAEDDWIVRQESLRLIFDSLEDLLIIVDEKSGQILNANEKAERVLGISKKKLHKMTIQDIHPKKTHNMHEKLMEALSRKKEVFEMTFTTTDEKEIKFKVTTTPLTYYNKDALLFVLHPLE